MPTHLPQHSGGTPTSEQVFQYAAKTGDRDQVQALLPSVDIDSRGTDGGTALHRAASYGQTEIVELLLAHGADSNAQDEFHNTPLHVAVATNQAKVIAVLLQNGASATIPDRRGTYPLWTCLFTGKANPSVLCLLLEHGADPLQNGAYEEAEFRGYEAACEMMRAYMPQL